MKRINYLNKWLLIFSLVMLTGCSWNGLKGEDATSYGEKSGYRLQSNMLKGLSNPHTEQSTKSIDSGFKALSTGDTTPATTQHTNELLYYWQNVSEVVDQLDGIAAAHVFVTNKNAYVALMFSDEEHAILVEREGIEKNKRRHAAPRSIASMSHDHFYTVENNINFTNQTYHDIARLVSNYAAPRQVFISSDHTFLHHFSDLAKIGRKQISLTPWLHEFNVLVQYYFADGMIEPIKIDPKKQ